MQDYTIHTFKWNRDKLCIFFFSKAGKFIASIARVQYNEQLTNLKLAQAKLAGEYCPCMDSF